MYFITHWPTPSRKHDSITVLVDKLFKGTHLILMKYTHNTNDIAKILMREVCRLHGLPKAIVPDKNTEFTSKFWKSIFQDLGTQLNFNITYHP
jgi:hypothetical protein